MNFVPQSLEPSRQIDVSPTLESRLPAATLAARKRSFSRETTMRVLNFLQGVIYLIGFLLVVLVVFLDRSTRTAPNPQLVPVPARKRSQLRS
jgi:hypothetical protein